MSRKRGNMKNPLWDVVNYCMVVDDWFLHDNVQTDVLFNAISALNFIHKVILTSWLPTWGNNERTVGKLFSEFMG